VGMKPKAYRVREVEVYAELPFSYKVSQLHVLACSASIGFAKLPGYT
jgi:hypothetical protein